jgi:hypothetical protein
MSQPTRKAPDLSGSSLLLRGPQDLTALGPFLKARRLAAGFRSAKQAAPHLGVTVRLLAEVERGGRTKRGITLGKLLSVVRQLGCEIEIRRRRTVMARGTVILPSPDTEAEARGVADGASRAAGRGNRRERVR